MQIINPEIDPKRFFQELKNHQNRILFLDYDGTLAPFKIDRTQAYPYPGVQERLHAILKGSTRLILATGRTVKDLLPLLKKPYPEIWGSHGGERLTVEGVYKNISIAPDAEKQLQMVKSYFKAKISPPILEEKIYSVALHLRGVDDDVAVQLRTLAGKLELPSSMEQREFDGGIEFRLKGINKGNAVRQVLEEMEGTKGIAYFGDDYTDEEAFAELQGKGLRVLVKPQLQITLADIWATPPGELLELLDGWKEAVTQAEVYG